MITFFKVTPLPEDSSPAVPVSEPQQEKPNLTNVEDTSSEEGVRDSAPADEDDSALKKSHYLERRSSSESSSEFSLGPRQGKVQAAPTGPPVPGKKTHFNR